MQVFVSPDFPKPQPYVDIIRAVADSYPERMIHKSIIMGKLATLEVYLNPLTPSDEDFRRLEERKAAYIAMGDSVPKIIYDSVMNDTVYDILDSGGYHQAVLEKNCVYSKIVLNVHPEENYKQFAKLVAHEMTHMLVCASFNLCSTGEPEEGGSLPGGSSIHRWMPESDTCYGEFMEEIIVHTVAEWLVKDLKLPEEPTDSKRFYFSEFTQVDMCNLLADAFGTPLKDLQYLDALSFTDRGVEYPNIFWYAFAVNRFGWIISIFNEVMGENAYARLCGYLDAQTDEDDERAKEMMCRFAGIYRETCRKETD